MKLHPSDLTAAIREDGNFDARGHLGHEGGIVWCRHPYIPAPWCPVWPKARRPQMIHVSGPPGNPIGWIDPLRRRPS